MNDPDINHTLTHSLTLSLFYVPSCPLQRLHSMSTTSPQIFSLFVNKSVQVLKQSFLGTVPRAIRERKNSPTSLTISDTKCANLKRAQKSKLCKCIIFVEFGDKPINQKPTWDFGDRTGMDMGKKEIYV
jgi:hypothetical protein